jgi:hypothetical protein
MACVAALDAGPVMAYQVPPAEMVAIWAREDQRSYTEEETTWEAFAHEHGTP